MKKLLQFLGLVFACVVVLMVIIVYGVFVGFVFMLILAAIIATMYHFSELAKEGYAELKEKYKEKKVEKTEKQ